MKFLYALIIIVAIVLSSCKTQNVTSSPQNETEERLVESDTVVISSDENTYEIIIIDPGYNAWLNGIAQPRGYYSQNFMETRNNIYVIEWNLRVNQPQRFSPELYQLQIDYNQREDYGYEINYKLYNYFIYFQLKYNQRLGPFVPRI